MDSDRTLLESMFLQICLMYKICKRKRLRRWKVRPNILDRRQNEHQEIYSKLRELDEEEFFEQTSMHRSVFELLLDLVGKELRKPRQQVTAEERLYLTLLFLAQGVPIKKLASIHNLGKTTVRNLILETCEVLWRLLSPDFVAEPSEKQYLKIAQDFRNLWDMPNCVGAIAGKHIDIKCPSSAGSLYSVMLMATCDANCIFQTVSVSRCSNQSDGGIFNQSPFGIALLKNTLPLPAMAGLSEKSECFPPFFVDTAVFPLRTNVMRPYPGVNLDRKKRIFNYRISRAHNVIENAFGILTARWQVLRHTLEFSLENCDTVILACIALHNFNMLNDQSRWYCPQYYADWEDSRKVLQLGNWRIVLRNAGGPLKSITSFVRRGPVSAFRYRDSLANYFVNDGAIPFQEVYATHPPISNVIRVKTVEETTANS